MRHYTGELMEVVNEANPDDLPMVLAALDTVEDTVRELPEYKKKKYATVAESPKTCTNSRRKKCADSESRAGGRLPARA